MSEFQYQLKIAFNIQYFSSFNSGYRKNIPLEVNAKNLNIDYKTTIQKMIDKFL